LDLSVKSTRISLLLDAPRARVYNALIDPQAVREWMVPDGMTSQIDEFEAREGGYFRISLSYDEPTVAGKTTSHPPLRTSSRPHPCALRAFLEAEAHYATAGFRTPSRATRRQWRRTRPSRSRSRGSPKSTPGSFRRERALLRVRRPRPYRTRIPGNAAPTLRRSDPVLPRVIIAGLGQVSRTARARACARCTGTGRAGPRVLQPVRGTGEADMHCRADCCWGR
jgi:hypothetical protein